MRGPRLAAPITLTSVLVAFAVALTVAWEVMVIREYEAMFGGFTLVSWLLLIVGSAFFIVIITFSILQAVWLVREIRTNQRQRDFIDAVTHELHTPLASLRLYVDTLRKPDLDDERRQEFVGVMAEDLGRLQRTIDRVLDAARSEARQARREKVDLSGLLEECVAEARERHGLDAGRVRLHAPAGVYTRGDLEQLRLAFRNLIENAIRYADESVEVDIDVRAVSGKKLEVEVADQGVGVPRSALRRIFNRFQRVSVDGIRHTGGLGLGLYIVRNVVRGHGGNVRAESDGVGTGTRFIVQLPGQLDERADPAG
jgi:signal transduction histidine kinase